MSRQELVRRGRLDGLVAGGQRPSPWTALRRSPRAAQPARDRDLRIGGDLAADAMGAVLRWGAVSSKSEVLNVTYSVLGVGAAVNPRPGLHPPPRQSVGPAPPVSAGLRHSRHGAGDLRGRGCAEVRLGARRSRPVGRRIGGSLWRSADVTSGIRSIPGSDRRALKSGIGTVAAGTLARHRPQRPATDGVPRTAPHGRRLAVREIARRLARALSTVSRELRRNLRPHDRGSFDGDSSPARAPGRGAAATKAAVESPARAAADRAGRARGRVERGVGRRAAAGSSSRAADCDLSHATIHWALHHGGRATWTGHRSRGRPAAPRAPAPHRGGSATVSRSGSAAR